MDRFWRRIFGRKARWTVQHSLLVALSALVACALLPIVQLSLKPIECKPGAARLQPRCRQDVPLDGTNGGPIDYVGALRLFCPTLCSCWADVNFSNEHTLFPTSRSTMETL